MKKHFIFLWAFTLLTVCSCAQIPKLPHQVESIANSSSIMDGHFGYEFATQEEFVNFIDENTELRKSIAENYPQNKKNELNPENYISIKAFLEPPFNAELDRIMYSGSFINYHYYLDGFRPTKTRFSDSAVPESTAELLESTTGLAESTTGSVEITTEKAPDILKGRTLEEYYEEEGLSDYAINEINNANNRLTLSWGFSKNGKAGLEIFAEENSAVVKKYAEGIYISDPGTLYTEEPYGKVIYWSDDDYFFYSTVPERYVDDFIKLLTGNEDFVSFVTYQANTEM